MGAPRPGAGTVNSGHYPGNGQARRYNGLRALGAALLAGLGGCASQQPLPDGSDDAGARQSNLEPIVIEARIRPLPDRPPEDLWERVRRGFQLPELEHARIESQLAWYRRHPDYMERVSARAQRYLYHVVTEIEQRGLPLELALLPIVESAYDPYAYSHGRAAGLWQFIPGTARRYGLEQDWWHDQRRDVKASTRAALDFLEDLVAQFDGDWLLALAGYNAGPGNVRRAQRRNRERGAPEDFFHLPLPAETRAYVPKLLALRTLIEDPDSHGVRLPELPNAPHFVVVDTGGQIDLAQAATLAGLDSRELYQLNPALNRWATHPNGPHRLLVPEDYAAPLKSGLAKLDPGARIAWHRHVIRPGESLSTIARRHGTDVRTLRQVNELSGNRIRAGDALLIPQPSASEETYTLSQEQRAAARDERFAANSETREVRYRVQAGDSFWSIARAHGVSVDQVTRWNGMVARDPLRTGRELVLWLPDDATASTCDRGRCMPPQREEVVRRVGYRVRSGDSLARIANRFGVSVRQIAEWNTLNPARYLQPGQQLVLYVPVAGSN